MITEVLFIALWLPALSAYILTQAYWWQVKEYRLDRFLVHLQTQVGKKLYLNQANLLKIIVLVLLLLSNLLGSIVFFFGYAFLSSKGLKKIVAPKLTLRIWQTIAVIFALQIILLNLLIQKLNLFTCLLILDLISPVIVALSIWLTGSLINFYKLNLIEKAKNKISSFPKLTVIGITGSFGKTTTKEFINQLLSHRYKTLATPGYVNTELGVAQFILKNLTKDTEILIVEMGAYKLGEVNKICQIVKPTIGVITAIGNQHLSLFGSMENITQAKFELIESLPEKGLAVLNSDFEQITQKAFNFKLKKIFYSTLNQADIVAKNIKVSPSGLKFDVHYQKKSYPIITRVIGKQNVANILASLAVCLRLGMKITDLTKFTKTLKVLPGSMKVIKSDQGSILIDDSHNINPEGVKLSLETLDSFTDFKKVVILSPMLELGSQTVSSHQQVLEAAGKIADMIIWIGLDFQQIVRQFKLQNKITQIEVFDTWQQALGLLKKYDHNKSVILFEGRNSQKLLEKIT